MSEPASIRIDDAPAGLGEVQAERFKRRAQAFLDSRATALTAPIDWTKVKWIPKAPRRECAGAKGTQAEPPVSEPNLGAVPGARRCEPPKAEHECSAAMAASVQRQNPGRPAPGPKRRPAKSPGPRQPSHVMSPIEHTLTELRQRREQIDQLIHGLEAYLITAPPTTPAPAESPAPKTRQAGAQVPKRGPGGGLGIFARVRELVVSGKLPTEFNSVLVKDRAVAAGIEGVATTHTAQVLKALARHGKVVEARREGKTTFWRLV